MAIKYLTRTQVESQLTARKAVEHWIGHKDEAEYRLIKWLRIDPENSGGYSVTCFEVFDEGGEDMLDIYSFSALDPDTPYGNTFAFKDKDEALDYVFTNLGVALNEFVGEGMIQDVYANFLKQEGLPPT